MKLDLVLENTRNRYNLGLLEESEGMSEKEVLKGKILINESTMKIRKMLVEDGTMSAVQQVLEEAWSQQLIQEFDMDEAGDAFDYLKTGDAPTGALNTVAGYAARGANAINDAASQAGSAITSSAPYTAVTGAVDTAGQAYDNAQNRIAIDNGQNAIDSVAAQGQNAIDSGVAAGQATADAVKDGLLTNGQAVAGLGVAGAGLAAAGGRGAGVVKNAKIGYQRENGTLEKGSGHGRVAHGMAQKAGAATAASLNEFRARLNAKRGR